MRTMDSDEPRRTVARLLRRSQAHAGLARAVEGLSFELAGRRVEGHPHTAWEQVEHLRLAAEDLVAYCVDADYREREWPAAYWPPSPSPPSEAAWRQSVARLRAAVERMAELIEDPGRDLYAAAPTAAEHDHHLLRAALLLLDHDGYHAGQLIALRLALDAWRG